MGSTIGERAVAGNYKKVAPFEGMCFIARMCFLTKLCSSMGMCFLFGNVFYF